MGGPSFQFHSGSIKGHPQRCALTAQVGFNSIVVRLKGGMNRIYGKPAPSFNSIVVRLKAHRSRRWIYRIGMFQFHSGSIKRRHEPHLRKARTEFQFHSGSIKSATHNSVKLSWGKFQFHSGSIKRAKQLRLQTFFLRCFNSIVVRLKVRTERSTRRAFTGFNSIVVRLKDMRPGLNTSASMVSIP